MCQCAMTPGHKYKEIDAEDMKVLNHMTKKWGSFLAG